MMWIRSAGKRRARDLKPPSPAPRTGRPRQPRPRSCALLVAVVTAASGSGSYSAAQPTAAGCLPSDVWCASVSVVESPLSTTVMYDRGTSEASFGSLSEDAFALGGATHTVIGIYYEPDQHRVFVFFDRAFSEAEMAVLDGLSFHLGDTAFGFLGGEYVSSGDLFVFEWVPRASYRLAPGTYTVRIGHSRPP